MCSFHRNDFDVETISSVAAGLQPSTDDIPDVKKVVYLHYYMIFHAILKCYNFSAVCQLQ